MTTLPDWMTGSDEGLITAADYEALPEEACRRIEIVDGNVVVSPSPRRTHQRIARNLISAFEAATKPEWSVTGAVDLRLRDTPLLNRRPDVVVYKAPDHEVLRPEHCLLVVEVMAPGSVTTDQIDKPGEYAAAGIRHFWRVEFTERVIEVFRYRLDSVTRIYALVGWDKGKLAVEDPIRLKLDLDTLR